MRTHQLTVATFILITLTWLANSNGALPQNTGAPGDLTCGRAPCHNIEPNIGDAQIFISVDDTATTYQPGGVHTLNLGISGEQTPKNGFQIVALNAQNENVGSWNLTASDQMKIIDGIGLPRKYVTHQAAGNMQSSWSLNWEAPTQEMGTVTFYASILDANNNNNNTGDAVYTTSISVTPQSPNSIHHHTETKVVEVFPNPAIGAVYIRSTKPMTSIQLLNLQGQSQGHYPISGEFYRMELDNLAPGLYWIHIVGNQMDVVKKLMVR